MARDFTDEQREAIYSNNINLLVSAGAGSGKTSVLVARIIRLITDRENPVNVDRFLVVTFTEAAAQEMKQRIAQEINDMLEEDPLNEHLRRQSILIGKAPISTIHAYCNSIIRQYFHVVGVDPSYRIADGSESDLLQEEAMVQVFEAEYQIDPAENKLFYDLIEIYSGRLTDERLKELVFRVYQFSANSPDPDKWLKDYSGLFQMGGKTLDATLWGNLIKNAVNLQLSSAIASAEEALSICAMENGPIKYAETLNEDRDELLRLKHGCNQPFEELYNLFESVNFNRLAAIKAKDVTVDEGLKTMVKDIRDKEIKYTVNAIKNRIFFKTVKELEQDLRASWPYMDKLASLVSNFRIVYQQKKREKNILDFNDLEHFALEILEKRPDIATALGEKYTEIFIDEYQDSNAVQEAILSAVAGERNRFMVGDVKQSIYKFRRAKPEIFMEKYLNYTDDGSGPGKKIDLSKNFRSRAEVINTVNFIFTQLMSRTVGEVDYGETEALNCNHTSFPESKEAMNANTEIILVGTEKKGLEDEEILLEEYTSAELEGKAIGKRILTLITGDNKVYDGELKNYRPIECKDIVILLRSLTNGETIAEELRQLGIPAYQEATAGFFQNVEVLTFLSLLKIIDNPRQDIHLIGVLHSPMYNLSADDLYKIRCSSTKGDFYGAIMNYIAFHGDNADPLCETLQGFLGRLKAWRGLSVTMPVAKLITTVLDETNYMAYIGVIPGGPYRQSNLRTIMEYALRYEKTNYRGLFHFIRYLEKLMQKDTKIGDGKISSQNQNAVRIMTIHKSKGLEFPVVFVSALGSKFNKVDERQDIILHQDYGFGPKFTDLSLRVKYDTLARVALAEKTQLENYSEELRVLYVALTRAKEKLILTGCVSGIDKRMEKWARAITGKGEKLSPGYLVKAASPLDWLIPAVLRSKSGTQLLMETNICFRHGNENLYNRDVHFDMKILTPQLLNEEGASTNVLLETELAQAPVLLDVNSTEAAIVYKNIDEKLSFSYPHKGLTQMPTKVLISEIKRNYFSQQKYDPGDSRQLYIKPLYKEPEFLAKKRKLTPAEKGTALHTVMEHLDIQIHQSKASIENLIQALYMRRLLTEQEKAAVSVDKILDFTKSDLGQRMRQSTFIKKEAPFVMTLSPREVFLAEKAIDNDGKVLVHGIIDCYFEEAGEIIIVDYKTDYVRESMVDEIIEKYRIQLSVYQKAIEKAYQKKVKESIVYLFHLDRPVKVGPA